MLNGAYICTIEETNAGVRRIMVRSLLLLKKHMQLTGCARNDCMSTASACNALVPAVSSFWATTKHDVCSLVQWCQTPAVSATA